MIFRIVPYTAIKAVRRRDRVNRSAGGHPLGKKAIERVKFGVEPLRKP